LPVVITRNGSRVLVGAALMLTLLVLIGTALIAVLVQEQQQSSCGADGLVGGSPGPAAETIPTRLMPLYQAAERTYGVPWNVLAAINKVETDFGRNLNVSSAGAIGWMQFMPDTWARYGVDGNDDGDKDPYDPEDAIPSAANYLRASGAAHDLHAAILAYNHAEWYYQYVISWARRFALGPMFATAAPGGTAPDDDGPSASPPYPLSQRGPIIATPADHRARSVGNWQSGNAIDIAVPEGTGVRAVANGTIERTGGSAPHRGNGSIGGYNITLRTADNAYFYAHLTRVAVRPGERVVAGQTLGESGYSNGVEYLHVGVQHGDPTKLWGEDASTTTAAAAACTAAADGAPGNVKIAAGANLPGRPITPETLAFLARVAGIYGRALIVTTGTNHPEYTVDGNISDHFDGHAADIGMVANGGTDDSPVGDAIAAACLIAAGDPPAQASQEAQRGGLWTREHDGLRVQCIWKTNEGGNHHTHVHIGARPNQ
jgi:murein DD-endopeptidase MepM/ murein hydrolase activator NlpD